MPLLLAYMHTKILSKLINSSNLPEHIGEYGVFLKVHSNLGWEGGADRQLGHQAREQI